MSTVIPNRLNDAMQQISAQMIQLMLENRRFGQEDRRLSQADRQLEMQSQNDALQRLTTIAPFLPHGKTIADMPEIHDTIKAAFPDFDPTNAQSMGGIVFNPETVDNVLRPMVIAALNSMPDAQKSQWTERALNRIGLGTPVSGAELEQGQVQAKTYLEAMHDLRTDPVAMDGIYRRAVGLEVPTRVMYQGREIKFDTTAAASITSQLWQHQDSMGLQWSQLNFQRSQAERAAQGPQMDLPGELMGQMAKNNIILGRAAATSVIGAYQRREEMRRAGQLNSVNDPVATLRSRSPAEVQSSIDAFQGAISFGENAYRGWLSNSEQGRQTLRFMDLSGAMHEAGVPSENIPGLLDRVTNNPQIGQTSGLPSYTQPGTFFGGNTLEFRSQENTPQATTGNPHQDLRTSMENDARALAEGRITMATINQKYSNPAQRNAVVMKSRTLRQRP